MPRAAKDPATGLTPKQEEFARWVVKLGNQGLAYRKAYDASNMSQHHIDNEAWELMKSPEIARRVAELRDRSLKQFDMEVAEIALGLKRIARADLRQAFDPSTGALLPIAEMPEDIMMAMSSIEVVEMAGGMKVTLPGKKRKDGKDGEPILQHVAMYTKKLRIADRKGALDTLAKWKQMLIERKEVGKPGDFSNAAEEEKELQARIKERSVKLGLAKVVPIESGKRKKP